MRTGVHFPVLGGSIPPGSPLKYCSSIGRAWYSYCQGLRFESLLYYLKKFLFLFYKAVYAFAVLLIFYSIAILCEILSLVIVMYFSDLTGLVSIDRNLYKFIIFKSMWNVVYGVILGVCLGQTGIIYQIFFILSCGIIMIDDMYVPDFF